LVHLWQAEAADDPIQQFSAIEPANQLIVGRRGSVTGAWAARRWGHGANQSGGVDFKRHRVSTGSLCPQPRFVADGPTGAWLGRRDAAAGENGRWEVHDYVFTLHTDTPRRPRLRPYLTGPFGRIVSAPV
jgi:hypothetical protein